MLCDYLKNEYNNLLVIEKNIDSIFCVDEILEIDDVKDKLDNIRPKKITFQIKFIFCFISYFKYKNKYNKIINIIDNNCNYIDRLVDEHNTKCIKKEMENFRNICGSVEDKELDDQQIESIVRNNNNQLVIAGAGSGKTTTIVGKVKYLLKAGKYNPNEILLLSFTNASASEMKERIKKETNIDLDVFTFHKLGLEIIKKSYDEERNIFSKELSGEIREILSKKISDVNYLSKLIYFVSTARYNLIDEFDFVNEQQYDEYLKTNRPKTLKGEVVKSYGELEIANFLFSNNIEYIYEKEYEYNTVDNDHQQYKPDFYLPEYKIYIEYFGIDENGNVAPYFKGKNGLSASTIYNNSIEWKRELHKSNNTIMIETYYYENKKGILIDNLNENLVKNNVKINPKSSEELWNIVKENNTGISNELCRTFETVINLIKSNNYTFDYLYSLPDVFTSRLNKLTLDLVKPIYDIYQNKLKMNNSIDFNDMINNAIKDIEDNKYIHNYKYVIVDEYQDISNSRYRLLKAMRNQKKYKLFCVGDDWQSIYRFTGSDIDLITNFSKYWGYTYTSFIEKTYRFSKMMSLLSGNFIMKNPNQIKKSINADLGNNLAVKFINAYTENKCIDFLEERLMSFEKGSTVYFLGRYTTDINIFKNNYKFNYKYNSQDQLMDVIYYKRQDLKIKFLTVHKSKGLQADYVVIINNKNYGMGFPSKINDLPIISLLLGNGNDNYPYSEERRLFYVALTRSKIQTLLMVIDNNKSIFVSELEQDSKNILNTHPEIKENIYKCPECGGKLVFREGKYGKFWGCSNYPDCKYIKK